MTERQRAAMTTADLRANYSEQLIAEAQALVECLYGLVDKLEDVLDEEAEQ